MYKFSLAFIFVLLTTFLSGCDDGLGIGEGSGLNRIEAASTKTEIREDDCAGAAVRTLAFFDEGNIQNISNRANISYRSSNTNIATVTEFGRVLPTIGGERGTVTITVDYIGFESSFDVEVTDAVLENIFIHPPTATLAKNLGQSFTVYGVTSDNRSFDITNIVEFTLDDEEADSEVFIDDDATVPSTLTLKATLCEGTEYPVSEDSISIDVSSVDNIELAPIVSSDMYLGSANTYTVTANFDNGDSLDVTGRTTVTPNASDDMAFNYIRAALNNFNRFSGNIVAVAVPEDGVTLSASAELESPADTTLTSNTVSTTVTDATYSSLALTADASDPTNPTMIAGTLLKTQVIAGFTVDGIEEQQNVSAISGLAAISDDDDLFLEIPAISTTESFVFAAAGQTGQDEVTAILTLSTGDEMTDTITVNVIPVDNVTINTVAIIPNSCDTGSCEAEVTFTDNENGMQYTQNVTRSVSWISSNPEVARVSGEITNPGSVTFLSQGETTINAYFNGFESNAVTLNNTN